MQKKTMTALLIAALLPAGPAAAQAEHQAQGWHDPASGIEFVWIAPGCFWMGASRAEPMEAGILPVPPLPDEAPRHEVCVDGFWMGKREVSRAEWQRIMNGGIKDGHPERPASMVAREDALRFLEAINARSGSKARFRLPTEAEWEYACHAGAFHQPVPQSALDAEPALLQTAWFMRPIRRDAETRDAGTMAPNAWGLHDMLGNVMEWVEDGYLENGYARHPRRNPKIAANTGRWVLRGGSFKSDWRDVRCHARKFGIAGDRLPTVGLRLVRDADARR